MPRFSFFVALMVLAACGDASHDTPTGDAPAFPLSSDASAPAVAVVGGETVTAWVDTSAEPKRLVVRAADGTLTTLAEGDIGSHSQAGPRLAAVGDALVVAYVIQETVEGRRFPASELRVTRSDDGGRTWSEPARPHPAPPAPTGHTFHSLAATPNGRVVLAWLDGNAKTRARAAGATPPVSTAAHDAEEHAGAHTGTGVGTELLVATSADGGVTWAAPTRVAGGTCECCRTDVTARGDVVLVVWRHLFDGGERDMAIARSDDGGQTFAEPVRVWADGWAIEGCPHAGPAVALDADEAIHVAWPTGVPGRAGLWHAVSTDGGTTFAEPTALLAPTAGLGQVRAATDTEGRAWLAFEDGDGLRLLAAGAADTLRLDGAAADLAAASAPVVVWDDGERIRVRDGS